MMGSGAIAGGEDEDERPGGRCSGAAPRYALSLCPGAATASSEVDARSVATRMCVFRIGSPVCAKARIL